eukprot:6193552-Pleurochrysis_carterae.AAC.4
MVFVVIAQVADSGCGMQAYLRRCTEPLGVAAEGCIGKLCVTEIGDILSLPGLRRTICGCGVQRESCILGTLLADGALMKK